MANDVIMLEGSICGNRSTSKAIYFTNDNGWEGHIPRSQVQQTERIAESQSAIIYVARWFVEKSGIAHSGRSMMICPHCGKEITGNG